MKAFSTPTIWSLSLTLVLLGILGSLITPAATAPWSAPPPAAQHSVPSVAGALNPDGTIKKGMSGNFDVRGLRMTTDERGAPRFVPAADDCADNWDGQFSPRGASFSVYALAVDAGGNVYVGGNFGAIGNISASAIARWNPSNNSWSALGSGISRISPVPVTAIAVAGNDVYVGGLFEMAGGVPAKNIARWNTQTGTWSALGSGLNRSVNVIAPSGSDLYVGGSFTTAGNVPVNRIARWNGSTWAALGDGVRGEFASVSALAFSGNDVYVGGSFRTDDGNAADSLMRWNGSTWAPLGTGLEYFRAGFRRTPEVYALAIVGSDVYVGGRFTLAGGNPANNIARWNGTSWAALGSGVSAGDDNAIVSTAVVSGGDLLVGGEFTTAGDAPANNVARWNGTSWAALGSGTNSRVYELVLSGSDLYASGDFTLAGDVVASYIVRWNGSAWSALGDGNGVNGEVNALTVAGNDVYVGGSFTAVGGVPANNVARWNGTSWAALGSGVSAGEDRAQVLAVAVSGGDVYLGGVFTTAGGVPANKIARWNGTSWAALGSGVAGEDTRVSALALSGSDLLVGGDFSRVGGVPANNIARWNGTSWAALGSGVDFFVFALAVAGSDVYAGGDSPFEGDRIARWDGTNWSALGSGIQGAVSALALVGNDLLVGGRFTMAGDVPANNIARWNGTNWAALGDGVGGTSTTVVNALAVAGGDVYVGGIFETAGDVPANNIARWSGTNWAAVEGGTDGTIYTLAASVSELYVGGIFSKTGCRASASFARYFLQGAPPPSPTPTAPSQGTNRVYLPVVLR